MGRWPRFALTYPVEAAGSVEERELPFVIGVLAQLSVDPNTRLGERPFIEIDRDNFDALLAAHRPPPNLEATWRALGWLVTRVEGSPVVKIRVLDVSKTELLTDFRKAVCFDQTHFFRKAHDEIYGVPGAEPFSVLVGVYAFSQEPDDLYLLEQMAQVAEVARAPFLSAAGPRMFGCEDFAGLAGQSWHAVRKLVVRALERGPWRAFQENPSARYVCLAWPGFLLPPAHGERLWGNPAFLLAATLAASFRRDGLCIDIVGEDLGGRIEGLPFDRAAGAGPTEVWFEDECEYMWHGIRLVSVTGIPRLGLAVIFSAPTCHQPPPMEKLAAYAIACAYALLPMVMIEARLAQCVKAMVRDRYDRFESREQCARFLNEWIARCIDPGEDASFPPARPLQEGRIEVLERAERPGAYDAVLWLRPRWWDGLLEPTRIVLPLFIQKPMGGNDGFECTVPVL